MNKKIWNKLQEFETRDLVEKYIQKRYGRKASARQVVEITSNFIQGREYFRNALDANISVKPLLLYYGVTALSRGLILACSPHISQSSLKASHGLSANNWQEVLSKKDFLSLSVSVTQGTFYDLLENTSNLSYFKHNTNGINWHMAAYLPPLGTTINFENLVQLIPDLKDEYKNWTEKRMSFLKLQEFNVLGDTNYRYVLYRSDHCREDIKVIFDQVHFGNYSIFEEETKVTLTTSQDRVPQFGQSFLDAFNAGMGEIVITKQINLGINISLLGQYYSLSFFLGMLCRYFPSTWIPLSRTEKGDSIFPLLTRIIDDIEAYYPMFVLEFLENGKKTT